MKLTVTSVPAAMFPLPEVVACTTPFCTVTICREVRVVVAVVPSCVVAKSTTPTTARPRMYRCQGCFRVARVLLVPAVMHGLRASWGFVLTALGDD